MIEETTKNPVHLVSTAVKGFQGIEKAVEVTYAESGITLFCGDIRNGKTSFLNSIMAGCAGKKTLGKDFPSLPVNKDSETAEMVHTFDNGIKVHFNINAKGVHSCTVYDAKGMKGNRDVCEEFLSIFALNLPKFFRATAKEKAVIYLRAIGVDLTDIDQRYDAAFQARTDAHRRATDAAAHSKALQEALPEKIEEIPEVEPLLKELEKARALEGVWEEHKAMQAQILDTIERQVQGIALNEKNIIDTEAQILALTDSLAEMKKKLKLQKDNEKALDERLAVHKEAGLKLPKEVDPDEVLMRITEAQSKQGQRAEFDRAKEAAKVALELAAKDEAADALVKDIMGEKEALLTENNKAIDGLEVSLTELKVNGIPFDSLSTSEQHMMAINIVQLENPDCGFVLVDRMESLGETGLKEVNKHAEERGVQVIGTFTGDPKACNRKIHMVNCQVESETEGATTA